MTDTLKDVPEFFEVDLGESILSRTESLSNFRELGPPDLCHVIKTTGRSGQRDIGSYHYVSGIDASSSASLAAYINSLTYSIEETPGWFSAKGKSEWKIRSGCFCTFNAFSRVDVRVEVKIPGGVDAYVVDLRGERHPTTPAIWTEAYLCALLRAILYADDQNYKIAGYRKLDPIKNLEDEVRFLSAAEACYHKGWQLGSDPEIQVATNVSNHLTTGILKYFGDSGRFGPAVNLFEKLVARDGEMSSLLAKAYLGMDEEVKAVQVLYRAIQEHPQSYPLLHVQCDFLRNKDKHDWAFKLAKQAVNCAPSEFVTWAKLTEVNIELRRYNEALLTLNSCPMFTYNERDLHRMPTPQRTHLPVKAFIAESGILASLESSDADNEADLALVRLPAPSLRGTWKKAYELLAKLVSQIGWDELLRTRSEVFVMEEEYRIQKQMQDDGPATSPNAASADGENGQGVSGAADDDASTRGMRDGSTPAGNANGVNGTAANQQALRSPEPPASPIPEIRISEHGGDATPPPMPASNKPASTDADVTPAEGEASSDAEPTSDLSGPAPGLEKPATMHHAPGTDGSDPAAAKDIATVSDDADHATDDAEAANGETPASFTNKRLCERWLDNLFMVLYEDLRVYTIWRAEIAHFKAQHLPYRKTGTEWEILGDLAQRLHHREEAKDAYQRCLEQKFSAKAWMKLLEYYVDEGDVQRALNAAIRLSTFQHRWYTEVAYPTAVATQLYRLIQREGVSKISYSLVSMNLPQPILKNCMQPLFQYAQSLQAPGTEF